MAKLLNIMKVQFGIYCGCEIFVEAQAKAVLVGQADILI